MSLIIFAGPSLCGISEAALPSDSRLAGPAQCGDLYLAAKQLCKAPGRRAIALIDGYFDHRLAVWHKEILWALSVGIRVYGAASMGALRAAELSTYGMVGIGRTYEQYQSGELEDDDEVAVIHEAADRGYTPRSEAMVDLRATLQAALAQRLLDERTHAELLSIGKSLFYADRTLGALLGSATTLDPDRKCALLSWAERGGRVAQKRLDALQLLEVLRDPDSVAHTACREPPRFRLSSTNYWRVLRQQLDARHSEPLPTSGGPSLAQRSPSENQDPPATSSPEATTADVARCLQLLASLPADLAQAVRAACMERAFVLFMADLGEAVPSAAAIQTQSERFRTARGLFGVEATTEWLLQNGLSVAEFGALAREECLIEQHRDAARTLANEQLPSVLRLAGHFSQETAGSETFRA